VCVRGLKENYMSVKDSLDTQSLIIKFVKIHGDNFDYSKVIYEGLTSKVIIICPEHGEFLQQPRLHLRGSNGCKICIQKRKKRKQ
jgi:hypothetical protein|tara:strand:- start:375 stop:629 length:255 start_codon:yes stop_codon:yes gene_type:complete